MEYGSKLNVDARQEFVDSAKRLGKNESDYPNLLQAYATTQQAIANARAHLAAAKLDSCVDVLGLGSMGRFEMSEQSDLDYLLICNSVETHDHSQDLSDADHLRSVVVPGVELEKPGSTGLFGNWIAATDLYEVIGLDADTNPKHSRRVLVLEESVSLLQPSLHEDLLRTMVSRYVEALPLGQSSVPRFLVNDLARYWRQLTVDYQAKSESGDPSTLRRLKLIGPRKFTYASSVIPLLTLELRDLDYEQIVDRLVDVFKTPPTLRFLNELEYLRDNEGADSAVEEGLKALKTIDNFNGLLSNQVWREKVQQASSRAEAEELDEFKEARELARSLQVSFEALFFSEALEKLTRKYLVF